MFQVPQAFGPERGKGAFVGFYAGFRPEFFQFEQTGKPEAGAIFVGFRVNEIGFVQIDGGFRVTDQEAVAQPAVEFHGRPQMPVKGMIIVRPGRSEIQVHGVAGMALLKPGLFVGRYHAAGRSHQHGHVPGLVPIIHNAFEWSDYGQNILFSRTMQQGIYL
jgi:hypothetical protein